jgi:hypothetical protein
VDTSCDVQFREGFWHWVAKLPDGTPCAMSGVPYATAEDAKHGMEDVAAVLGAASAKFFERRVA